MIKWSHAQDANPKQWIEVSRKESWEKHFLNLTLKDKI